MTYTITHQRAHPHLFSGEPGASAPVARSPGSRLNRGRWLGWSALLILAGYLLFSHGCHWGDEDTELLLQPPASVAEPSTEG